MPVDHLRERFAEDVLHDDPFFTMNVVAQVVEMDEVGVFEVEAMGNAPEFGIRMSAKQLEGHFFASIADGEINLSKSALPHTPFKCEAVERTLAGPIGEFQ